jgi:cysteinyl-tRNA synthetase
VHHTNEIAQSEAATGAPFAHYWLHGRFLVMAETGKMAKSAGGFLTVDTLKEKGYDPLAYRYFCFSAHYRKQLEFSWEAMDTSARNVDALRAMVAKLKAEAKAPRLETNSPAYRDFTEALADDLNLSLALATLWGVMRSAAPADEKLGFALEADKVLALDLDRAPVQEALAPELAALIKEREAARKAKDFKRSDELRKALSEKGVLIEDTPKGTIWKIARG